MGLFNLTYNQSIWLIIGLTAMGLFLCICYIVSLFVKRNKKGKTEKKNVTSVRDIDIDFQMQWTDLIVSKFNAYLADKYDDENTKNIKLAKNAFKRYLTYLEESTREWADEKDRVEMVFITTQSLVITDDDAVSYMLYKYQVEDFRNIVTDTYRELEAKLGNIEDKFINLKVLVTQFNLAR